MEELVVLVDEENNVLGTMPKASAHQARTPLHRAFSLFLFNPKGELLLQQRSGKKKTWPLVWSNSCCGHPGLDEKNEDAIRRRLSEELGLKRVNIFGSLPYRYCFLKDGIMENEICPFFFGTTDESPDINPNEVEAIRWVKWADFMKETSNDSAEVFSPWCKEQSRLLANHPGFAKFIG
ncbi:MAG: isopentenyl-diphosphate Delta-isomerase [Candidatus Liptonbacteria bacterium]|nr:isopentenyl-diphosphate Delta-isomerase [Candidatus Liptonbacteria bacterium]